MAEPEISGSSASSLVARHAHPLASPEDVGGAPDRWSGCRIMMLGEASHGTAEFYSARAAVTRHMIMHHGVTIVAVEADWPDAAVLNRHVRGPPPKDDTAAFQRFPRWMWRNPVIAELLDWMREWNRDRPPERQAGFYGLDMYNLSAAVQSVLAYLEQVDPGAAEIARQRYGCLQPWIDSPGAYGRAALSIGYHACEEAVVKQCRDLLQQQDYGAEALEAAQNARLIASAERYYRIMYRGGPEAWNLRDSHMCGTLSHLLSTAGPESKAVVWAHNSHIGDARQSGMGQSRGEHNLGQLARQRWGDKVALIGFGTHKGTVTAASDWGGRAEVMSVRPSHPGSLERECHDSGLPCFVLDMNADPVLRRALARPRPQRFIGVIYRPDSELLSHYMQCAASRQYDGWVWFDQTSALAGAEAGGSQTDLPDTWPFGM